ncbi:class C sortase [Bifidobacterium xylocopae]|uniref:class C sortase n=1 Tax=Bifidobacterium xylocopae TaxID=2493119 RepID=UPI001374AA64|nr:class C sortase [Bifidobacterium xylocopae]
MGSRQGQHAGARIKWRSLTDLLIFLIGLGIFMYPLVASYVNYQDASASIDAYDSIVSHLTPAQKAKMWKQAKQYDEALGKPTLRDPFRYHKLKYPVNLYNHTLNVDGKGMMAYVDIPKISVKLPVYHGTSDEVLLKGTGHIATTHIPTDNRTQHGVITGHTGAVGHILFDNLTQMKKGDIFQVRVLDHHLSYKVDQIRVILPSDVRNLQPVEGRNYVTLLTCTPYGINSHRLLVRGRYIGEGIAPTQPKGAPKWVLWVLLVALLITALLMNMVTRKRRQVRIAMVLIRRNYGLGSGGPPGVAGGLPGGEHDPDAPSAGSAPTAGGQIPRDPASTVLLARSSLPDGGGSDDDSGDGSSV